MKKKLNFDVNERSYECQLLSQPKNTWKKTTLKCSNEDHGGGHDNENDIINFAVSTYHKFQGATDTSKSAFAAQFRRRSLATQRPRYLKLCLEFCSLAEFGLRRNHSFLSTPNSATKWIGLIYGEAIS